MHLGASSFLEEGSGAVLDVEIRASWYAGLQHQVDSDRTLAYLVGFYIIVLVVYFILLSGMCSGIEVDQGTQGDIPVLVVVEIVGVEYWYLQTEYVECGLVMVESFGIGSQHHGITLALYPIGVLARTVFAPVHTQTDAP